MKLPHRGMLKVAVNVGASGIALAILFNQFGSRGLTARVVDASPALLLLGFGIVLFLSLLHAQRWGLILRRWGAALGRAAILRLLFVGYFFNQTLPSSFGGDAVRIWMVHRHGTPLKPAIYSVVSDRIMALLSLSCLCPILAVASRGTIGNSLALAIVAGGIALGLGAIAGLKFGDRLFSLFRNRHISHLSEFVREMRGLFFDKRCLSACLALSMAIHLFTGIAVYVIASAVHVKLNLDICLTLFPLVTLASMVPISYGGWGVREGATIFFFSAAGVAPADSLLISIMFGLVVAAAGLPGGLLLFRPATTQYSKNTTL